MNCLLHMFLHKAPTRKTACVLGLVTLLILLPDNCIAGSGTNWNHAAQSPDESDEKRVEVDESSKIVLTPELQEAYDAMKASAEKFASETPGTETPDASLTGEGESTGSKGAKNLGPKKGPETQVIRRPAAGQYVPQSIDQEIRRNPDGKVSFSFKAQPWEPVLQWLADASALSLDWQELPADSLNLMTSREYSMEEARDLFNRHLLSRGFTMIVNGEIMSIVRTKDLNPALVRRVVPGQLKDLPDHTICKVSFNLDWLIADEAVEELKPMLSSAGQIHKLSRTNRLEVVDTAASLRQLWELIENEQSSEGEEQLVRAFRLKHRRADDVIRMLKELMNLRDSAAVPGAPTGMDPEMASQMMEQAQQQMQQMLALGQATEGKAATARPKVETRLVLNPRENMILAQAAPDQMAIIEKAVEQIDVAREDGGSLLQNLNRMKIYRLESIDPQTLVDLLQQLGDLDPGTTLKVDQQKRSIIAWASLADHLTITTLVDRMDQSSRKIEVIQLRRLDAEYVAGTIRLLMGKEEAKEENPYGSRFRFFDFEERTPPAPPEPSFKVEADTENNRLLVNANSIEMDEIRDLLVKLGELPDPNSAANGVRVFQLNQDEDLELLQERLQRSWRRGNRLQFDLPQEFHDPARSESEPDSESSFKPRSDSSDEGTASWSAPSIRRTKQKLTAKREVQQSSAKIVDSSASRPKLSYSVPPNSSRKVYVWTPGRRIESSSSKAQEAFDRLLDNSGMNSERTQAVRMSAPEDDSDGAHDDNFDRALLTGLWDESNGSQRGSAVISPALLEKLRQQIVDEPEPHEPAANASERPADDKPAVSAGQPRESNPPQGVRQPSESADDVPVRISLTSDGKLIVSSDDPEALLEMEDLISQVASPRKNFKVFRLKYATPSWVTLNLKDYFKSEEDTKNILEYNPFWGITPGKKSNKGPTSLSKRRQPQFISDNFTSTILVRDADAKQLQTIEELIAIYDVTEPSDSRSMRVTTIFRLRNARASVVADAIKDVFRDLLSSNDKALSKDDQGEKRQSSGLVTFLPGMDQKAGDDEEEEPIRFKGLLSMGIDETSNTLIVSSSGALMDTVGELIEELDKAADSSDVVQVIQVDKSVDLGLIKQRLDNLLGTPRTKVTAGAARNGQPRPDAGQAVPGMDGGVGETSSE